MIAGSVVYWGSDTLAGAIELVVKLCTHAASCKGEKLVETLAKQAQGPLLCSQIRLKTTCLCRKWKKEKTSWLCQAKERQFLLRNRDAHFLLAYSNTKSHTNIMGFLLTHTLILSSHLSLLLKLTFLAGRELWSGQCVKGLPLQGQAQRKRICLAVENNTGSRVNQESSTLRTLSPAHSCNKTLCLEVKKDRKRPELWSWVAAMDWTRRWEDFSLIAFGDSYAYINIHWVKGCMVLLCAHVHVLLCMRALLKEPE